MARRDYIAGRGVDAIWISPFYPPPIKDPGYDVAATGAVLPGYGDPIATDAAGNRSVAGRYGRR